MTSPWDPTPRGRLTDQEKAKLYEERGRQCWRCTKLIRPGEVWTVEHLIALENGGTNEWSNLDICCANCKPVKDRDDHAKAAKSRHVRTYHTVPNSERDKRRGFRGWRKMNGEPVWKGR